MFFVCLFFVVVFVCLLLFFVFVCFFVFGFFYNVTLAYGHVYIVSRRSQGKVTLQKNMHDPSNRELSQTTA